MGASQTVLPFKLAANDESLTAILELIPWTAGLNSAFLQARISDEGTCGVSLKRNPPIKHRSAAFAAAARFETKAECGPLDNVA